MGKCHCIKVIRNIGNSVVSFFAADSGVEKVLYYDRQVLNNSIRGVCSIPANCPSEGGDSGINCFSASADGLDCTNCTNCTIIFSTNINDKIYYQTTAIIDGDDLEIDSLGTFDGAGRKVQISINGND